jgi:hypothetical protein
MIEQWLLSPEHFCVAPSGDFKGLSDTCYWGLPSIQAADPAYPPLGYCMSSRSSQLTRAEKTTSYGDDSYEMLSNRARVHLGAHGSACALVT